ncbi:MAG: radical SAM protein [Chromatiales bacterium]|nr:radical SAM protein [Chromatiales bacterium]
MALETVIDEMPPAALKQDQRALRPADPSGEAGYIAPHALEELWFHTGTACNLACPFCLEGSAPGDNRLQRITFADAEPLLEEAAQFGVRQLSFTGGEPFIVRDFVRILARAAHIAPCLVLTNGTDALLKRLHQLDRMGPLPHPVSFRISIDWPDRERHEAGRGAGTWAQSWQSLRELDARGFGVSLARQSENDEDTACVEAAYRDLLRTNGLPEDTRIVAFPDFGLPGEQREVPRITTDCMTRYHTMETRRAFMCAYSKMVVKRAGRMRVYACTLVDDDPRYELGDSLAEAMRWRIGMQHQRCYACFRFGASCSER